MIPRLVPDLTSLFWRGPRPLAAVAALALLLSALPAARSAEPAAAGGADLTAGAVAGSLVIVGGGALPDSVGERFLELAGGKDARIVVIPTASAKADTPELLTTPAYFKGHGAASVTVLHTRDPKRADDPAFVKPLTEATGVWFSGGSQSRLIAAYRGTAVERELRRLLARGGVIGGTSAGAAVMSPVMIVGGQATARVGEGFGFLQGAVVDQHFVVRNRAGRLLGVVARYPQYPGLGIDEQTAIVVKGTNATVVGNGTVSVCLPSPPGQAPRVERVLKAGEQLDLAALTRELLGRATPSPARDGAAGGPTEKTP